MKQETTRRFVNGRVSRALALAYNATMQAGTIKTVIVCTLAVAVFNAAAHASDIAWQAPTTISGTSDVSLDGIVAGTWGPGDDWGGANRSDNYPVNGVTFNAYGSGPFGSWVSTSGLDDRYCSFPNPNTGDTNYNYLLQTAVYSYGSSISLTWGGLTPGNTYELEFWVNDGRNSITAERSETLTGGANTSAALAYGTGPSGTGPGQFIIGAFVADGTGTQTLTLNAFGGADIGPSAQVNLLQLRNVTLVSAPTITGLGVSGTTLSFTATNGPPNGAFVLLQSGDVKTSLSQWTPVLTNSFDGSGSISLSTNVVNPSNAQQFYILHTQQ